MWEYWAMERLPNILDIQAHTEIDLQGGLLLAIEIRLKLEIANPRPQKHDTFIVEFHPKMGIDRDDFAFYQCITLSVKRAIQT